MKIRIHEAFDKRSRRFHHWEKWFAWHPVIVDGELILWEYVNRKLVQSWYESYWIYTK